MCQSLFFKKETLAQVFSCDFCETSKNTFFYRAPMVAASVFVDCKIFRGKKCVIIQEKGLRRKIQASKFKQGAWNYSRCQILS